ncbi:MAG: hypothetical protein K2F88_02805, partial [Duncaniella sp.]|nr:hypothetical protein [Duncaniella sp.]
YIISSLVGAAMALQSCSNIGCTENQNSLPLAGFYSMSTGESIIPDSIEIGGVDAPSDTLLLSKNSRVRQLYLPFRSTRPSTSFYIHYCQKVLDDPRLNDTLTFDYEAVPYFASEDCGAMYHYRVTAYTYTTHLIDSVGMTDSLITNIDRETIRIFFRTAEPENPDENGDND